MYNMTLRNEKYYTCENCNTLKIPLEQVCTSVQQFSSLINSENCHSYILYAICWISTNLLYENIKTLVHLSFLYKDTILTMYTKPNYHVLFNWLITIWPLMPKHCQAKKPCLQKPVIALQGTLILWEIYAYKQRRL
jgi:hypothetical protein